MTTQLNQSSQREEVSVSTLELFFDLVFVFTLTQLTELLTAEPTPEGILRVVLMPGPAVILGAGLATYLVGDAMFRRVFGVGPIAPRLAVAVFALLTIPLGLTVNAGVQLVALVVLLVGVLAFEELRRRQPAGQATRLEAR
jgi:low temperature requirement protein LtrA